MQWTVFFKFLIPCLVFIVFVAAIVSVILIIIPHVLPAENLPRALYLWNSFAFEHGFYLIDSHDTCDKYNNNHVHEEYRSYNIIHIYVWLVGDTFLYLLLYNYFVCIFPGKYGHAKSYLFPVKYLLKLLKTLLTIKSSFNSITSNKKG